MSQVMVLAVWRLEAGSTKRSTSVTLELEMRNLPADNANETPAETQLIKVSNAFSKLKQ